MFAVSQEKLMCVLGYCYETDCRQRKLEIGT